MDLARLKTPRRRGCDPTHRNRPRNGRGRRCPDSRSRWRGPKLPSDGFRRADVLGGGQGALSGRRAQRDLRGRGRGVRLRLRPAGKRHRGVLGSERLRAELGGERRLCRNRHGLVLRLRAPSQWGVGLLGQRSGGPKQAALGHLQGHGRELRLRLRHPPEQQRLGVLGQRRIRRAEPTPGQLQRDRNRRLPRLRHGHLGLHLLLGNGRGRQHPSPLGELPRPGERLRLFLRAGQPQSGGVLGLERAWEDHAAGRRVRGTGDRRLPRLWAPAVGCGRVLGRERRQSDDRAPDSKLAGRRRR
jgi:hypothetical protein